MSRYQELLRDPRWQRKRLEVMNRFNFRCAACKRGDRELHVHHRYYVTGRLPWEYPDSAFVCLCEPCHGLAPVTDDFHEWEAAIACAESRGLDGAAVTFLLDALHREASIRGKTTTELVGNLLYAYSDHQA